MAQQRPTFQQLLQVGISTATHVIKKETRDVYVSYFKKFCDFCISNEYPDPAIVRHHELPSLLVAFMESVSSSNTVSNQTAEKIRAAGANYYGSYERRDAAGPDTWRVATNDQGESLVWETQQRTHLSANSCVALRSGRVLNLRNAKQHLFPSTSSCTPLSSWQYKWFTEACRLWFVAVSAFAFYGMCRINEVLSLQWKNLTLGRTRKSTTDPNVSITFGIYKLEGRKTDVAEGRCYNLHHLDSHELPIDTFFHLSAWLKYVETKTDHTWSDTDYVFPALSKISKGVLMTKTPFTCCENVRVE